MEQVKKCSKCGEEKPKTEEFFGWKLKSKGCFRSYCKVCEKEMGAIRWGNRSNEQKAAKRERDRVREAKKRKEKPDYYRLAQIKRLQSENFKRWYEGYKALNKEKSFLKKIGSFCDITAFNCRVCGVLAVRPTNKRTNFCKVCTSKRQYVTGLVFSLKDVECVSCGKVHVSKRKGSKCDSCNRATKKVYSDSHKRFSKRCYKYGVRYTTINRVDVYRRDSWKCVYCGVQVVRSKHYATNQATIDHVIPLSKGGTHTIDNVVTACHHCNSEKNNNVILKTKKSNQLLMWLR